MNIVVLKNNIKEGLFVLSGTKKDNNQLPILKNFLLEAVGEKVVMKSTDLEIGVIHTVSAKILQEGAVTIPYTIFSQIINNLPDERVTIELKGAHLTITTDNYRAKISTAPKDDFPIIPQISEIDARNTFAIDSELFIDTLSSVLSACQMSDFRPELSGTLFHYRNNEVHLVATDSFRLAKRSIPEKKVSASKDDELSVIIPLKTAQEVIRIFSTQKKGELEIVCDKTQILFKGGSTHLISRLIEGKFPDYEQVIPKAYDTEILIAKDDIMSAIKLISSLSNRLNEVKVIVDENMRHVQLVSSSQEFGESEYILQAKIKGSPVQISFNWRFVIDGVKNIKTQQAFIGLNGEQKPSVIKAPDDDLYQYVLTSIKSS